MNLFADSFQHTLAEEQAKWDTFSATLVPGRNGQGALLGNLVKDLGTSHNLLFAGIGQKVPGFDNWILRLKNSIINMRLDLEHVGDGRLRAHYFSAGEGEDQRSAPSTKAIDSGQWYYFELKGSLGGGQVTFEAHVNEQVFLSGSLTIASPAGSFRAFDVLGGTVDDFYADDAAFQGDVRVV